MSSIDYLWYRKKTPLWPLLPFSWLFQLIVKLRKYLYTQGFFTQKSFPVPLIVVGNLTVGGTGKTPLVGYIVTLLKRHGYKPGVVSRGYKGQHQGPLLVDQYSDSKIVGDEACMLFDQLHCPLVIGKDRTKAVDLLLKSYSVDVVISDDGLQHYAMNRSIEIAVVDGDREFGNQHLLPVGPLREPVSRLNEVDLLVVNEGRLPGREGYYMRNLPGLLFNAKLPEFRQPIEALGDTIHAVAALGNPNRYLKWLEKHFKVIPHIFPDHHVYQASDIYFPDDYPVILTDKDYVKCKLFLTDKHWVLPIQPRIEGDFDDRLLRLVEEKIDE